jgi:hypothetical protein
MIRAVNAAPMVEAMAGFDAAVPYYEAAAATMRAYMAPTRAELEAEAGSAQGRSADRSEMTEVTKPDGSRFVSRDTDLDGLSRCYRTGDGYSLRPVAGQHRDHGFRITEYLDKEAGQ